MNRRKFFNLGAVSALLAVGGDRSKLHAQDNRVYLQSWAHGHTGMIETPDGVESIARFTNRLDVVGWPDTVSDIHFGIPITRIWGRQFWIYEICLRYRILDFGNVHIEEVIVLDGDRHFWHTGSWPQRGHSDWDTDCFSDGREFDVQYGIGITARIAFGPGDERAIRICAVGANFFYDQ